MQHHANKSKYGIRRRRRTRKGRQQKSRHLPLNHNRKILKDLSRRETIGQHNYKQNNKAQNYEQWDDTTHTAPKTNSGSRSDNT